MPLEFLRLLTRNFANCAAFIKILNTNRQILHLFCKMKHCNQNRIVKMKCLHQMAFTSFLLSEFLSKQLLGIMKSTFLFSIICNHMKIFQIVENCVVCLQGNICRYTHMPLKPFFCFAHKYAHKNSQLEIEIEIADKRCRKNIKLGKKKIINCAAQLGLATLPCPHHHILPLCLSLL